MIRWPILLFFCTSVTLATTFKPVTMPEQIREADGVIIGHYLKKKTVLLENGKVATQMIFQMDRELGMNSDLFGTNEVIIHFPGGTLNGITTMVQGVPAFTPGEKVVLMARSVENRYWGLNLGLGSFRVINYGKETMLINSIFPEDPRVGQVPLSEFEGLIRESKGTGLKFVLVPQVEDKLAPERLPASVPVSGKKRSIASVPPERENGETSGGLNTFWLLACLAILGGFFRSFWRRGIE
jgi:hypothetical protein